MFFTQRMYSAFCWKNFQWTEHLVNWIPPLLNATQVQVLLMLLVHCGKKGFLHHVPLGYIHVHSGPFFLHKLSRRTSLILQRRKKHWDASNSLRANSADRSPPMSFMQQGRLDPCYWSSEPKNAVFALFSFSNRAAGVPQPLLLPIKFPAWMCIVNSLHATWCVKNSWWCPFSDGGVRIILPFLGAMHKHGDHWRLHQVVSCEVVVNSCFGWYAFLLFQSC